LGERQHERHLWKRHRAQQRLHIKPICRLDDAEQAIRQAERGQARGRRERCEAPGLVAPELIVVDQVCDCL